MARSFVPFDDVAQKRRRTKSLARNGASPRPVSFLFFLPAFRYSGTPNRGQPNDRTNVEKRNRDRVVQDVDVARLSLRRRRPINAEATASSVASIESTAHCETTGKAHSVQKFRLLLLLLLLLPMLFRHPADRRWLLTSSCVTSPRLQADLWLPAIGWSCFALFLAVWFGCPVRTGRKSFFLIFFLNFSGEIART